MKIKKRSKSNVNFADLAKVKKESFRIKELYKNNP